MIVPYVTAWSPEQKLSGEMVERQGIGIGYADEMITDRDDRGVLWYRSPSRPGDGHPRFGDVHPLRQQDAMRRLLCQVCGGPADRTSDGVLWLILDHREDWATWPEGMAAVEPPICVQCVHTSVRLCPALRRGAAVVRVRHCPIVGVRGALYRRGKPRPVVVTHTVMGFDDPAIRWIRAVGLVRQLRGCTIIPADSLGT
jgi:hypothetical protein